MSRFFRRGGDSSDESSSSDEEELLSQDSDDDGKPSKPSTSQPTGSRPMSRFLRTDGDGDSDSTSEDEEGDSDDDANAAKDEPVKKRSRFLKGADSDSSDEESVKHIVKSAKDKRIEELEAIGATIEQKLKINDWAAVNSGGCNHC